MAVRQYIGARYVPIFYQDSLGGNTWESGVQYEPLTIVTYLNQSYTSKKTVPTTVGNPADNSDYWVVTGGYNSQVAQLSQDVEDLRDSVDDYINTKYIVVGDSIMAGLSGTATDGYIGLALLNLGISSDDYRISCVGGSCFTGGSQTYEDQLDSIIASVDDNFKNSRIRIIVSTGMHNDLGSESSYFDAVDSFVSKARANFPRCTFEYLPLSWGNTADRRISLRTFFETYVMQLATHGFMVWSDLYAWLHNYTTWYRDQIHPSAAGIQALSKVAMSLFVGSLNPNPEAGLIRPKTPTNINENFSAMANFPVLREMFDGRYIHLIGNEASFVTNGAEAFTFSTSVMSPTVLCDNPFYYIGCTPFTEGRFYGNIPCTLRAGTNFSPANLVVNRDNKLCVYTSNPITVNENGGVEVNVGHAILPREYC